MATRTDTDNFNRADASPVSGDWGDIAGNPEVQIVSNRIRSTTIGGGGSHSRWTLPFPANQISIVHVITLSNNAHVRILARAVNTPASHYITLVQGTAFGTVYCELSKFVAGAYSNMGAGTNPTLTSGGTVACDAQGTTIRSLIDGVQVHSVTDSSLVTGTPGIGVLVASGGALSDVELDDWSAECVGYPVVMSSTGTDGTTASAAPVINLPSEGRNDVIFLAIFRCSLAGAIGWPAGWNELADNATDASANQTAIAWKVGDGTEAATMTLSCTSSKFAASVYEIYFADQTTAPALSTIATGTSASPDPTAVTPAGGSKDYLILWLGGWQGEQTSPPASAPTNYNNGIGGNSGAGGATTTNVRVASAWRHVTGTTEDPPAWTISVSDVWTAYALAVYPKVVSADVTTAITTTVSDVAVGTVTASGGDILGLTVGNVTVDTGFAGGASRTISHNHNGNVLLVGVGQYDVNNKISSVTWNSANVPSRVNIASGTPGDENSNWFGVFTTDTGTHNVIVNYSPNSSFGANFVIVSVIDADASPFGNTAGDYQNAGTSPLSTSISMTSGSIAFDLLTINASSTTVDGSQTQIANSVYGAERVTSSYKVNATTMGWTWTGTNRRAHAVLEIKAAAAGAFKPAWARNCNQLIGVGAR